MHRQKGTQNTPKSIIDKIVKRHRAGATVKTLAEEYGKPCKTITAIPVRIARSTADVVQRKEKDVREGE